MSSADYVYFIQIKMIELNVDIKQARSNNFLTSQGTYTNTVLTVNMERRSYLAHAAAVIGGAVGCLDRKPPHHRDIETLLDEGIESYHSDQIATTGDIERHPEEGYVVDLQDDELHEVPLYELRPSGAEDTDNFLFVVEDHDFTAPNYEEEYTVNGHIGRFYLDEDDEEERYGIMFRGGLN